MSKSSALPQQKLQPYLSELDSQPDQASGSPAWKQEINQRLAAHRNRRSEVRDAAGENSASAQRAASGRAAEAAARVAARYAKAPSYSQMLAGEARAAVRAAGAAAEAARHAQVAAQAVLAGIESSMVSPAPAIPSRWQDEPPAAEPEPVQEDARLAPWSGAQSRWEETAPLAEPEPDVWSQMRVHSHHELDYPRTTEQQYRRGRQGVDEGELFPEERFDAYQPEDPLANATIEPVQHLPANLIEFPRELVATRKARPRLAEGPLYDASRENPQLSIFEVDPVPPAPVYHNEIAVAPPEWASIELDHISEAETLAPEEHSSAGNGYARAPELRAHSAEAAGAMAVAVTVAEMPEAPAKTRSAETDAPGARNKIRNAVATAPAAELLVASMSDRALAAVVDGALVTMAFLAGAVVVIAATSHPPAGKIAMMASVCGWLVFAALYQLLFLSYAEEGTPGMRYARIALCTFDDDNPTPAQMRMRIPAMVFSALPAGLGLLWALWDKDRLGWHDRMTKTYQRKY